MARNKPILLVDFDGCVHSYTSGWQGATVIADPPTPGALRWLWKATEWFDVNIYSSRTGQPGGLDAMRSWLENFALHEWGDMDFVREFMAAVKFPDQKPAAFLTIDDRALTFEGDWSEFEPADLLDFKPWNKRLKPEAAGGSIIGGKVSGEGLQPAGRELNALELGAEARRLGLMGSYE